MSASDGVQKFFFDLLVSRPVRPPWAKDNVRDRRTSGDDADLGPRVRTWGNLRITSAAQQINSTVAEFAGSFAQQFGNVKVNEVAQSFEFLGGFDMRLYQTKDSFLSFDRKTRQRFSLDFILGAGAITPLSARNAAQAFQAPANQPEFFQRFPQAMGKQFVVFTLQDRDRFFKQAYGGLRISTHFIEDRENFGKPRFPATFDITGGFNESVTGGRIRGAVLRLEGFVPMPYTDASWIYLFGTGMFKPGAKVRIQTPFLLDPVPAGTSFTSANAVVIPQPQTDRDYYRIGFGIDFVDLVKTLVRNHQEATKPH